jgi:hypothetical protein
MTDRRRFARGMNAEDHASSCAIRTERDGWDATCTCGGPNPAVPVSALRMLLTDQAGVDQDWHHEWHLLRKRLTVLCDQAEGTP